MEKSIERILLVIFVATTGILTGVTIGPSLQAMLVMTIDGAMFFEAMLIVIGVFLIGALTGGSGSGISDTGIYFLLLTIAGVVATIVGTIISTM